MERVYNKLVRDKIPKNINSMKGRNCNYKILDEEEYLRELDRKLLEEAHEFIEQHNVEELGDLMEVIYALMKANNITKMQVENARLQKLEKKGGFDEKIYLINVEQEEIDQREELEMKKEWRRGNKI